MYKSPYIPPFIFVNGMMNSSEWSLKDFANLSLVSKEYHDSVRYLNKDIISSVFRNHYESMYCQNIGNIISNSHIDVLELERVLGNMYQINSRKYGEKYSHLLRQKIVRLSFCDQYVTSDPTKVKNTMVTLIRLYKYVEYLAQIKPKQSAPTNLRRRVTLWCVDYVSTILYNTCRSWFQYINKNDIIRFCSVFDSHHSSKCSIFEVLHKFNIDIIEFFKSFTYGLGTDVNTVILDTLVSNSRWWEVREHDEEAITHMMSLMLCMSNFMEHKTQVRNRILLCMFEYVYMILRSYKNTLIHDDVFKPILIDRCDNFIEQLQGMSYETETFKEKLLGVCTSILQYCHSE